MKMAAQKSCPSFASIISVLSIVLYCGGFLRVELEFNKQRKRIDALETDTQVKPPPKDPDITKISKNTHGRVGMLVGIKPLKEDFLIPKRDHT